MRAIGTMRTYLSYGPALVPAAVMAFVLTVLMVPATATAQEYSLYGDLELGTTYARFRSPPETVETLITDTTLRLNHLLLYDWGEMVVRHRLTVFDLGDTEGDPLRHDLQHAAAVMWPADTLTVQVGRHSLPWGMGSAFFPADALHPERTRHGDDRGFDGASTTWTISPRWTMAAAGRVDTATGSTEEPLRDLRWAGLLSGYLGRVDVMVSTVYQPDEVLRPAAGVSLPLGGVILHGEGSLELAGEKGPAVATGMHYTLFAGFHSVTLAVEHLYTEQLPPVFTGFSELSTMQAQHHPTGRHFLYPMIFWEGDGRWSADVSALIDLEEARALLRLELARHILGSLTLAAEGLLLVDEDSGEGPREGIARFSARVHF